MSRPLPIEAVVPDILSALAEHRVAVVRAPTGAGKTTRVPLALLEAGVSPGKRIVVLEPRRVAARAAARRMADVLGCGLGDTVGYRVRFERRDSPATRVLVVTEGIFLRMLQGDPFIEDVSTVILDEFHERHVDTDLALALTRQVQLQARPDLALLVMSATLQTAPLVDYLGGCPAITSEGRSHPVDIVYDEVRDDGWLGPRVAAGIRRALRQTDGGVLAFLPGMADIRRVASALGKLEGVRVFPLHGNLPGEQQDLALRPSHERKVVLATNVAETSVTIPDVTAVVDSGLAKVLVHDSGCGLNRLETRPISRASADQRAGRAGRTAPGRCYRLWTRAEQHERLAELAPELRRIELSGVCLQLLLWGESDLAAFPWFEAPDMALVDQALAQLRALGALGDDGLTRDGRQMARLPVEPRLARLLLAGRERGVTREAALAAAMLSERDPFRRTGRPAVEPVECDVTARVDYLEAALRQKRPYETPYGTLAPGAVARLEKSARQLHRLVGNEKPGRVAPGGLQRALLAAYADRLARRREAGSGRALMVGGRGVRLGEQSGVRDAELFVCVALEAGRRGRHSEARVSQACGVESTWLEGVTTGPRVVFDERVQRVVASEVATFGDLVISEKPLHHPEPDAVARALLEAARADLGAALSLDDPLLDSFRARIELLREHAPELGLAALDEAFFTNLLPQLCEGRRSLADLRKINIVDRARGSLEWAQQQALKNLTPTRFTMPDGRTVAIRYQLGKPPILAARIQQFFGMATTPRIVKGRVPLLLHLLAPNMRPQQVTDDLASFWSTTYAEVRRELRRRYPKHKWPEKPNG